MRMRQGGGIKDKMRRGNRRSLVGEERLLIFYTIPQDLPQGMCLMYRAPSGANNLCAKKSCFVKTMLVGGNKHWKDILKTITLINIYICYI